MVTPEEKTPGRPRANVGLGRRQFLKLAAVGLLGVMLPVSASFAPHASAGAKSPPTTLFSQALRIPPVLAPSWTDATTDFYDVTQKEARVEILPGLTTTIWGYEGQFPGPTIKGRVGRRIVVRQTNLLPDPVVVHQHGGLTSPEADGYPTESIPPGGSKEYVYPNQRRASTMWYHDHAMDATGYHVYMGLAGFYILTDDVEDKLPLPKGDYDVPLLIQDRSFAADGALLYQTIGHVMTLGDTILVNGTPWPRFEVANRRYRFRILNGSNSQSFNLALSTGEPLTQIGTDGGLLPAPVRSGSIPLGMAERAEVVIDFSKYPIGSRIVLRNLAGSGDSSQIMCFDVVRQEVDDSQVPEQLRPLEVLPESAAIRTRTFKFGPKLTLNDSPPVEWLIDGKRFDPLRIDATPALGSVEIWRFVNETTGFGSGGMEHPVHVHLVNFQILDRNGKQPAPYEGGWKDTVVVPKGEEARVIMRFDGYRGKYIMHCHNLSHEDSSMMTNFEVL